MTNITLSDELRRFIHSIESVPHLEAMLLLHQEPAQVWSEDALAKRLYLSPQNAAKTLLDLCDYGICAPSPAGSDFRYAPSSDLDALIGQLAIYYSSHLIEVTNMIHARNGVGRRAHLFADAFKFKKED